MSNIKLLAPIRDASRVTNRMRYWDLLKRKKENDLEENGLNFMPYTYFLFPEEQATLHDESVANRVKHAVPCYHAGGTLLAVGTTCWYTHTRFGG